MKSAIIYARVSSKKQVDGVSMESQIEQCRLKAHSLETEVVKVFRDDGVSGRTDKRPGFQAALAYCAAHRVSHMICWSTSRFGRNLEDALKNTNQLSEWGTRAAYVHQDIDLDTDAGWMLGVMTGMMDEVYSRNIARDTLRSMITASKDGYFVGGRAPFGYQIERVGKRSKLGVHEDQAAIVRTMYALALNEGLGAQAVAHRMNAAELKRDGKAWAKNSVAMILKNPSYMGVRLFNQTNYKTRENKPAEEVVQVISHPAIVSKEDFEKVQAMMKDRTPHEVGGTPKSCFAFTGLLTRVLTTNVVTKVVDDIRAHGGKWAEERTIRRKALVREQREEESKRDKIYEIMETLGKEMPNMKGTLERLSVLQENIKGIQDALYELEHKQAPDYRLVEIDPKLAVETIHRVIKACPDPKQLRMLMHTFVQKISVSNSAVVVEYREDALLSSPTPTVHSGVRWLLDLGSNQGPTD